jgi:hypothetical protein
MRSTTTGRWLASSIMCSIEGAGVGLRLDAGEEVIGRIVAESGQSYVHWRR